MKVVQAPVPIIRGVALSDSNDGSDQISFNFDISIDGPTHSGLATSAFTSYLSDHLPNLAPLTMVLKKLLQVGWCVETRRRFESLAAESVCSPCLF